MMAETNSSIPLSGKQLPLPKHPLFKNLTGKRFGNLFVLRYAGRLGKYCGTAWECQCDCGTVRVIWATRLQQGLAVDCGCTAKERTRLANITHGMTDTRTYHSWQGMRQRCYCPKSISYPNYGARGIRVCDRWNDSFAHFLEDMGVCPSPRHEIDRVDNEGNYKPGNCRWADRIQNARNKRSNHLLTFNGEALCLSQWCERLGFPKYIVPNRLRRGWSVERALTTPLGNVYLRNKNK